MPNMTNRAANRDIDTRARGWYNRIMIRRAGRSNWGGAEVPGYGDVPNRVMVIGERPGLMEAQQGRPFVGPTGEEQRRYFAMAGLDVDSFYVTNLVKTYEATNADPTPDEVATWGMELEAEIGAIDPAIIIAVGRFSSRWFLGDIDMRVVHGIVHASPRAPRSIVIPCYHPSWGLHDPEARTIISYDYSRASAAIKLALAGNAPAPAVDRHVDMERYEDVTGQYFAMRMAMLSPGAAIGLDTEGYPDAPWSIQISATPGTGLVLRCEQPDFSAGIDALRDHILGPHRPVVAIHNAMYDIEMSAVMGLDLFDANIFDSMYAAYLTRLEPKGLKALAYRWCGMAMTSYGETVGDAARQQQLDYLEAVIAHTYGWPKPDPRVVHDNDGTSRLYTPARVATVASKILADCIDGKVSKDGELTDPIARWKKVDQGQRERVELGLGRSMPRASLADIPLDRAVRYSGRDPDATLRLYYAIKAELGRSNLTTLMGRGMGVLPVFEEMQRSGMPASRRYFVALRDELTDEMRKLQSRISHRFYGDQPFNPASPPDVEDLMKRQRVKGEKYNKKTKRMSTAKKSIEHLRHTNEALGCVIDWREMQKNRDSFCQPIIDKIPEDGPDVVPIRCEIKTTTVATRRLAASNPNLLAIPARNEAAVRVRDGFVAPDGYVFGEWDLSQAELRVMAGLSRDPLLMELFIEKRDPHAETAARIFGIQLNKVDEMKHRYPAKRAGFGVITSITGSGLYDQLRMFGCAGWSVEKCDKLIEDWLSVYSGVAEFMEQCKKEARENGIVFDYWGMPRYLTNVWSDDRKAAAEDERAASSHKIQGGAQGMLQESMAWLKPYIRDMQLAGIDVRWRLQIHDSLLFTFPKDLWETMNALVLEALTEHHGMELNGVPMVAKGNRASTWGRLK